MQNRNQSDDHTVEQQRKLVAARRKHVGELAAKVRSARRQKRLDVVMDERRELLSAAKEYLWQKQKLDGMRPSDEQSEYADAFDMWGQAEEIDITVAELNSKPALDVMAVLARYDAISKLHEKRSHLLQMESSEIEPVAQAAPASEQTPPPELVQAAPAEPVLPPEPARKSPGWTLTKPKKLQGINMPVYKVLLAAHQAGRARPTARDVLDEFGKKMPAEVAKVLPDGLDYYDSKGGTKGIDLDAIRNCIGRMAKKTLE